MASESHMPRSSPAFKSEPPLAKAVPISPGGSAPVNNMFKKGKNLLGKLEERTEAGHEKNNYGGIKVSEEGVEEVHRNGFSYGEPHTRAGDCT